MNGYCRISSTEESKSAKFSDLSFVPKTTPNPIKNPISNPHDNKENQNRKTDIHESIQEHENEDTAGEIFGVILSRKCTLSSNPGNSFMSEKQSSTSVHSALKRTLSSIKRSTSVSDGYCRIHHQCDQPAEEDDIWMQNTFQTRSVKKKGKVLRACKRILGL